MEAIPFDVEKLIARVSAVHGSRPARSAAPGAEVHHGLAAEANDDGPAARPASDEPAEGVGHGLEARGDDGS